MCLREVLVVVPRTVWYGPRPIVIAPPVVSATSIKPGEAARLLKLTEDATRAVEEIIARGAAAGASSADKAAAKAVSDCMNSLTAAIGPVSALVTELRKAVNAERGAVVTQVQVAAVEAFTDCLAKAEKAKESPRVWDAIVGVAVPVAGYLAIAL